MHSTVVVSALIIITCRGALINWFKFLFKTTNYWAVLPIMVKYNIYIQSKFAVFFIWYEAVVANMFDWYIVVAVDVFLLLDCYSLLLEQPYLSGYLRNHTYITGQCNNDNQKKLFWNKIGVTFYWLSKKIQTFVRWLFGFALS